MQCLRKVPWEGFLFKLEPEVNIPIYGTPSSLDGIRMGPDTKQAHKLSALLRINYGFLEGKGSFPQISAAFSPSYLSSSRSSHSCLYPE